MKLTLQSKYADASIGFRSVSPEGPWPIKTVKLITTAVNSKVSKEHEVW